MSARRRRGVVAEDEAGGEEEEAEAEGVEAGFSVAAEGGESPANGGGGVGGFGFGDGGEEKGRGGKGIVVVLKGEDAGVFADHFHLALSEALGEDGVGVEALEEFGVVGGLAFELVEVGLELEGLGEEAAVFVGLGNEDAAGDEADAEADEGEGTGAAGLGGDCWGRRWIDGGVHDKCAGKRAAGGFIGQGGELAVVREWVG